MTSGSILDASTLSSDLSLVCDVAIIGTGAGGGMAAEILSQAGLSVLMIEEGPYKTAPDFKGRERDAYRDLYRDLARVRTEDRVVRIYQGRCVGGGTTVNLTSSLRTPDTTLSHWADHFGLSEYTSEKLTPEFERVERRLGVEVWEQRPNRNNEVLIRGAEKLGLSWKRTPRNVIGCQDLGQCGIGCPVNAKQSMLVTTIPSAIRAGARLVHHARAEKFEIAGDQVSALVCTSVNASPQPIRVRARHYVLAAGGIASPGVLLRSAAPDPHQTLGKRTFLHPTVATVGVFPGQINGTVGAPQSVYCEHYPGKTGPSDPIGFIIEMLPVYPMRFAGLVGFYGPRHLEFMMQHSRCSHMVAILRDGFHPQSTGGSVRLGPDGKTILSYPWNRYLLDGIRRSFIAMAELQFAAGAERFLPVTSGPQGDFRTLDQAKAWFSDAWLSETEGRLSCGSAHVMGGCAMGADPRRSVVSPDGVHHQLGNLSVMDASVFPTGLGVNPQLTIFAVTARNAARLAARLKG